MVTEWMGRALRLGFVLIVVPVFPTYGAVSWINNPTTITVPAGQAISLNLSNANLVTSAPGTPLTFKLVSTPQAPPTWIHIAADNQTLISDSGHPALTEAGVYKFGMAVNQGNEAGAIVAFDLVVASVPNCGSLTQITGSAPENTSLQSTDASKSCSDPGGAALTYKLSDPNSKMPSWLTLSGSLFRGLAPWTPTHSNVGTYSGFSLEVDTASGGKLLLPVTLQITRFFMPPIWTANPINLPDAQDGVTYNQNLSLFVTNFEGTPLQYSLVQGVPPDAWVSVNSTTGSLSGIPTHVNDGAVVLVAQIATTDPQNPSTPLTAQTKVDFKVDHVPMAAKCSPNPIILPDTTLNPTPPYQQDLSKFCTSPSGDTLAYSFTSGGPGWANVASLTGLMSGTPQLANLGLNQWTLQVATAGAATASVTVQVKVDKRPVQWTINPIVLPAGKETVPVTANLTSFLNNPDQGPVTCSLVGTSDWISVNANCTVSGTPKTADIGNDSFQVQVSDGTSAPAVTTVQITIAAFHAPAWTQEPITLPDAKERSAYSNTLQPFATDPYQPFQSQLTYTKLSGPQWISVNAQTGAVTGTPARSDVTASPESFVVQLKNPSGLTANATVTITVDKVPRAPVCTSPVALTSSARKAFTGSLTADAKDLDNEALTFSPTSGPAWLQINSDGVLSGTPADSDQAQSPENFVFTATNTDSMACTLQVTMTIQSNPHPIVPNPSALTFEVKERITLQANLADPTQPSSTNPYLSNPDHDTLTCAPVDSLSFVTLSSNCQLTLSPIHKDVSSVPYQYHFTVSGGPFSNIPAVATIKVDLNPRPPVWNPTSFGILAISQQAFTGTLANKVTDLDGYPLMFSLSGCPTWLQVNASTGALSGTPQDSDVASTVCTATAANPNLSANATLNVTVVLLRWTQNPVTLPSARSLQVYPTAGTTVNLSPFVLAGASDPLTFSRVSGSTGAPWAQVSSTGTVTGTPATSDVGNESFQVQVSDSHQLTAVATVKITVLPPFTPPSWTTNPIPLPVAPTTVVYNTSVLQYISNPNNLPITCSKAPISGNGPQWLTVNANCTLTGTPALTDVGSYTVTLQLSDGQDPAAQTAAFGKVVSPVPPIQVSPMTFTVKERATLTQNLNVSQYIVDPNAGATVSCQFVGEPPSWLTLTSQCLLTLTPKHPDINTYAYSVKVSDSVGQSATGNLNITVIRDAQLPVCKSPVTFQATAGTPFTGSLAGTCVDPDGVAITYSAATLPSWLSLDSSGNLTGTPQEVNDGVNAFTGTGKNDVLSANFTVQVTVQTAVVAPQFVLNPIQFTVKAGNTLTANLNDPQYVKSPDGSPMTFALQNADAWVILASNGQLTATPQTPQVGDHTYPLVVTNPHGSTGGSLILHVLPGSGGPVDDSYAVDQVVPWATPVAENLWIIDSTKNCFRKNDLVQSFEDNMSVYYQSLNSAQVEHTGIYVSSNPVKTAPHQDELNGDPVPGADGSILLTWDEANIETDFQTRIDDMTTCSWCSAPIWGQYMFYQQLPSLSVYQHTYFVPEIPTDTLIITNHADSFKRFARGTSMAGKSATDFANDFLGLHKTTLKPYRINAILADPPCNFKDEESTPLAASKAENSYFDQTEVTGGKYWIINKQMTMSTALQQYADQVKFRALVLSKKEIPLSKTPSDPTKVQVYLGGQLLPSNEWAYNATKNVVVLRWDLINLSTITPGEKIEIKYTSNSR
jgi:hypothetical protein